MEAEDGGDLLVEEVNGHSCSPCDWQEGLGDTDTGRAEGGEVVTDDEGATRHGFDCRDTWRGKEEEEEEED